MSKEKLLEPSTIAYFSVFTVEKNRREKKVRKTEGLPHRGERLRGIFIMLMTNIYQ